MKRTIIHLFLLLWLPPFAALAQTSTMDSLLNLAEKEPSDTARITRLLSLSDEYLLKNANYAIEFSLRALYLSREIDSSVQEDKALAKVGTSLYHAGVYDEAVKYFVAALDRAEAKGDKKAELKMRFNLTSVKLINAKYDESVVEELLKILSLAEEIVKTSGDTSINQEIIPLINNHLAYLYHLNGEFSKAEGFLKKSLAITGDNPRLHNKTINSMIIYAEMLLKAGKTDEAIEIIQRYQAVSHEYKQPAIEAASYLQLARAYDLKKNHPLSIKYLKQGYQLMKAIDNVPIMADVESKLSKVYEESGQADSALHYANLHEAHLEKVTLSKANEELARFDAKKQFRQVEETLKAEKRAIIRGFILTAGAILLVLILAIYLYVALRKRYRDVTLEKMNADLTSERLRLEKQLLEAQLESSNKQAVAEVMSRMKRNEMVREVVDTLISLKRDEKKEVRTTVSSALRQLEQTMENQAMEDFELRFKNIHHDFFKHLQEQHPGLTPNERRLCAFLKLDLSIREIAALTGQSTESIYMARSRLRQKLGLQNTEQALADFIAGLS